MGAAFLTKLKVAINEEFSWGMSRISKGEGCQKWGIKYNEDKTSLPIVKFVLNLPKCKPPHKCTILNKLD